MAGRRHEPRQTRRIQHSATLRATREGQAYVEIDEHRHWVSREHLLGALPGDQVSVELVPGRRGEREGRVRRVLERHAKPLVGLVFRNHGRLEFRPYRAETADHFVLEDGTGFSPGDQVAAMRVPPLRRGDPERVRVVERLGRADEARFDSQMVALEKNLPLEFPAEVRAAALEAATPPHGVPRGRLDLRELLTATIDPPDAKDHDDALSLRPSGTGWELGIHIADVSVYVRGGTPLDDCALERGNSVYLPDLTLPMLPEELSADVCSLRPGVDRLALSVLVHFDAHWKQGRHRVAATVIRSDHKLHYEEAERMLRGEIPAAPELKAMLQALWKLTAHLKESRRAEGALDLMIPETRVILDPKGEPLDVVRSVHRDSHQLVEECMILANRIVGLEAAERGFPFLYRIHDAPAESRIAEFTQVASALGFKLPERSRRGDNWIRNITFREGGEVKQKLLQSLLLRSLAKARYSPEDIGHYGLGITRYAHFTSPIRRYPDLVNHRQVHAWLRGAKPGIPADLEEVGDHCSETEVTAMEAERAAVQVKCVRFMEPRVGDEFPAVVTGIIRSGFFVELLDFPVEGMVRFSGLHEDHYVWEPELGRFRGTRTGVSISLGDDLVVRLARADLESRQLEFVPAVPFTGESGRTRRMRRARRA